MTAARTRKVVPIATPTPVIVDVTPAMAHKWLAANTVNRKVRMAAVNQYAADMATGRWSISADAISFSPAGLLLNGQHRLHAVIAAGVTVPMLVLHNVPVEAMSNMDAGRKRSTADDLAFHGETHAYALASAVKLAVIYTDGRIYKDRKLQSVSNGEVHDFLAAHGDLRQSVTGVYSSYKNIDLTPTVKSVGHWLFSRAASPATANNFFDSLASRVGLPEGSPILALDSRLRELRRNRTYLGHRDELALLVKTWNHWRANREVRTIAARNKDGRVPTVSA